MTVALAGQNRSRGIAMLRYWVVIELAAFVLGAFMTWAAAFLSFRSTLMEGSGPLPFAVTLSLFMSQPVVIAGGVVWAVVAPLISRARALGSVILGVAVPSIGVIVIRAIGPSLPLGMGMTFRRGWLTLLFGAMTGYFLHLLFLQWSPARMAKDDNAAVE